MNICRSLLFVACLSILGCESASQTPKENEQTASAKTTEVDSQKVAEKVDSETESAKETDVPTKLEYWNPLTEQEQMEGWISLFDGQTLFGWTSNALDTNWHVEDNAITASSGPKGLLLTDVPFANYEFVCEYRMEKGGNSGVFVRALFEPKDVTSDCYEVNIADEHPDGFLTGSLVGRQTASQDITGSGDWNTLRITADQHRIAVSHNDTEVVNYVDETEGLRKSGLIGLQKNSGKIEFRKVILKPLGMKSLFNGKDLSGWREIPGSKSEFSVEDGAIHVVNGQGFYETKETYQDFIFQAQSKTNAAELNSGYFFRAIAGTEEAPSNGYEVQIHNGYKDDDRTQPANAGTGAIFRRIDARYVVPNDEEWFNTTLIAHGPNISVWVNGFHVVNWADERQPDPNPRRGLRLEGGHISLQGHDPTTDLLFRKLQISEFPQ